MFEVQINKMKEIDKQKNEIGHEIADFINNQIKELRNNDMLIKDEDSDDYYLDSVYWDEEGQSLRFITALC